MRLLHRRFAFLVLPLSMVTALPSLAAEPFIALQRTVVCGTESVSATAFPPRNELGVATGFDGGNGFMFDVSASQATRIRGLKIFPRQAGSTVELYYRPGTHVGHEGSAAGWTLVDTVSDVPTGTPYVDPGFDLDLPVKAGETVAFYVTATGDDRLGYAAAFGLGQPLVEDEFLTVKRGVGVIYPFVATGDVRVLRGALVYEPEVVATTWNTGQEGRSIVRQPQRPELLAGTLELSSGDRVTAYALLQRLDLAVEASAAPGAVPAGASSRLDVAARLARGLATPPDVRNNREGAMFDLRATAEVRVFGFTVSTVESSGTADLRLYGKPGSHVGSEDVPEDWALIAEYSELPAGEGRYLELPVPLDLGAGEVRALYVVSMDAGGTEPPRLRYGNGSDVGSVAASGDGLEILEGTGVEDLFGRPWKPRVLATVVHFERRDADGLAYDWSTGATSRSVTVSPASTTAYSVDVSRDGCVATGDVTVTVLGGKAPVILKDDFEG